MQTITAIHKDTGTMITLHREPTAVAFSIRLLRECGYSDITVEPR